MTRPAIGTNPRKVTLCALALLLLVAGPGGAAAQSTSDPAAGGQHEGVRGGHRGGGQRQHRPPAPGAATQPLARAPAQRLDPGAVLCRTEQQLQQHQAAVTARLDGNDAEEPAGCHIVATMTPVSLIARHGPARAEVRLPTTPDQNPPAQIGWTDAAIPNGPAPPAPNPTPP